MFASAFPYFEADAELGVLLIFDIQPARGKQPIRKAFDHVNRLEIQFRLKRISSGRKIISEHVFMCTA